MAYIVMATVVETDLVIVWRRLQQAWSLSGSGCHDHDGGDHRRLRTYIVMAYIVMAYIVMALDSYGLCSYGTTAATTGVYAPI